MDSRNFILATAGHVDHGKSALVKALTGIDPDRLPEEKARGITIDLGFAHLELPMFAPQSPTVSLGIVDVPGHEDFVKNMVAGVGSIDLALLVVAADDGWMPQTEEHVQILTYLGVQRAVVALTKIDLVGRDANEVIAELRPHLQGTPLREAPIVPTSVVTGRGLEELKITLARVLAESPPRSDIGKPRLPVDRVFTLRGIGTVVTGTLTGGVLRRDQAVVIQPSGRATRVRSLQSYNREVAQVGPGTRAAINLPDAVALDNDREARDVAAVRRGDVITLPEFGAPSDAINVELVKSSRLSGSRIAAARPLKDGTLVRVHAGSGNYAARVVLADGQALAPGERALAQLRFDTPVFVFIGDRFIVRDWSGQATLAGGVVLDAEAERRTWRTGADRSALAERANDSLDAQRWIAAVLPHERVLRPFQRLLKSRFSQAEIAEAIGRLQTGSQALQIGSWLADPTWWQGVRGQAVATIDAGHQAHPERLGLPLAQLRADLGPVLAEPGLFDVLVRELCQSGFVQAGVEIRRATHQPALPPTLREAGARLRATLTAKALEPPSRRELAPDQASQQALRFLVQTGAMVEIGPDVVLLSETFAQFKTAVLEHLQAHGSATVSELRQVLHTTRRILVPLLERLDREGFTRRDGDRRRLGRSTAQAARPPEAGE